MFSVFLVHKIKNRKEKPLFVFALFFLSFLAFYFVRKTKVKHHERGVGGPWAPGPFFYLYFLNGSLVEDNYKGSGGLSSIPDPLRQLKDRTRPDPRLDYSCLLMGSPLTTFPLEPIIRRQGNIIQPLGSGPKG